MKLYIWKNPFPADYSGDWVIAVANNIDEARQLAAKEIAAHSRYDINSALEILKGPETILETPAAEWFHWEE